MAGLKCVGAAPVTFLGSLNEPMGPWQLGRLQRVAMFAANAIGEERYGEIAVVSLGDWRAMASGC